MKIFPKTWLAVASIFFVGSIGFLVGRFTNSHSTSDNMTLSEWRSPDLQFKLLNPLLDCESDDSTLRFSELKDFTPAVSSYIETAQRNGLLLSAGVYFRDLNNGPWRSINASADFSPASLLKVPLMIAYLKWADTKPDVLDQKLPYTGLVINYDQPQPETPTEFALRVGQTYRTQDLIERMIVYSDNNAKNLLQFHLPEELLSQVLRDIGIPSSTIDNPENSLNVREYASFFRVLFNASYLSREYSELALEYLSRSTFDKGLVGGIPSGISVAHKYGVRNLDPENTARQLHDCGIVYFPNTPYLLCIMTRGNNFGDLATVITKISDIIYKAVSNKP